jgi:hypothetical protein
MTILCVTLPLVEFPISHFLFFSIKLNFSSTLMCRNITIYRPLRCVNGCCKCCCYQEATFSSGGNELGRAQETCWFCVPSLKVYDHTGSQIYFVHPPTWCAGMCVNCCAEGDPCEIGCCKGSDNGKSSTEDPYV